MSEQQPKHPNAHTHPVTSSAPPLHSPTPQIHSFSRWFAKSHGVKASIICGYLINRISSTGKRQGEGYRCTLDDLASHYPYLSRSCVASTLKKLVKKGILKVHHKNFTAWDRTTHYAFANQSIQVEAQSDPIYFDVHDATQYDLPSALLLMNLRMRLDDEKKRDRLKPVYRVCARKLSEILPLTPSTISRALKRLAAADVIKVQRGKGFDRSYFVDVSFCHKAELDSYAASPDLQTTTRDLHDAKTNDHDANQQNNITLKGDIESEPSKFAIESFNSYEARPATPSAERASLISLSKQTTSIKQSIASPAVTPSVKAQTSPPSETPSCYNLPTFGYFTHDPNFKQPAAEPLPATLSDLRKSNMQLMVNFGWSSSKKALNPVSKKVSAILGRCDPEVLFRWLDVKKDEDLYAIIREYVERTSCMEADYWIHEGASGVNHYCAEWLVDACRAYLDTTGHYPSSDGVHRVRSILARQFDNYYEHNKEQLEKEGLAHLRNGEDVRLENCVSPDADLEDKHHLSAAEKARVFQNAVLSINKQGHWTKDGALVRDLVSYSHRGWNLVRRFFEINPDWTAGNLLEVLNVCIEKVFYETQSGYREDFACTRGNNIAYLMKHMELILGQLRYDRYVPPTMAHFLTKEDIEDEAQKPKAFPSSKVMKAQTK